MNRSRPRLAPRHAVALIVAIVALAIVSLVSLALMQMLLAAHRQSRQFAHQAQAAWLAESALARGAARLRADRAYRGETWLPGGDAAATPAEEAAAALGRAVIRVESDPDTPSRFILSVEALVPDDPIHRARQQRRQVVSFPPAGDSP
jgi:Tfp pilus assembly protein PilX